MSKRKLRINFVDILILLVILAAVAVLVYVYAGKGKTEVQNVETVFLEFVVEIPELNGSFTNLLTEGNPVEDAISRVKLGRVYSYENKEFLSTDFDAENNREVYKPVQNYDGENMENRGLKNLYITIHAEAVVTDHGYMVNGKQICVGEKLSLRFPDMYAVGYCINLRVLE